MWVGQAVTPGGSPTWSPLEGQKQERAAGTSGESRRGAGALEAASREENCPVGLSVTTKPPTCLCC